MDNDQSDPHIRPPSFVPDAKDGDAKPAPEPRNGGQFAPAFSAQSRIVRVANLQTQAAEAAFLPDLSSYDLTVGEALDVFSRERRKRPADRTLQRYCQDGRFDCYKLKTTRNGNPVHEWIINSTSLLDFIRTKPVEEIPIPLAAPNANGVANKSSALEYPEVHEADAVTTPDTTGDAESDLVLPRSGELKPTVTAAPAENHDAKLGAVSRVELLIENAKMTARLDSQNDLIGELREDKKFMREQITHNRQNDTLMSDMHKETLHTLKAVSVAGRHTKIEMPLAQGGGAPQNPMRDAQSGEASTKNSEPDGV